MAEEEKKQPRKLVPKKYPMPEQDPKERVKNFNEVPLGQDAQTAILEAQRCLQCKRTPEQEDMHGRMPGRDRHPEVHQAGSGGQLRRGHQDPQGEAEPPGGVRPRLPLREPVRGQLHGREEERAGRHRQAREVPRRLGEERAEARQDRSPAADRQEGRGRRRRPSGPDRRG